MPETAVHLQVSLKAPQEAQSLIVQKSVGFACVLCYPSSYPATLPPFRSGPLGTDHLPGDIF
jgi:hypothetical protein